MSSTSDDGPRTRAALDAVDAAIIKRLRPRLLQPADEQPIDILFANDPRLLDDVLKLFGRKDDGDVMPWAKTHECIRFRPGEITAWIGPNGDGKSLLTGFLAAHWASEGISTEVVSLEMGRDRQLARIARQMLCVEVPTAEQICAVQGRLAFLIMDGSEGHIPVSRALRLVAEAAERGVKHIVLDNMTMICPPNPIGPDESALFACELLKLTRNSDIHVHLVGHVRKPNDETKRLTRYDWRGTGALSDLVHNVVIVQRNMKKARADEKGEFSDDPDVFLIVDKQRNGEYTGLMKFWYRPTSMRLVQRSSDQPESYL
jgi:twinkle protein